MSNTKGTNLAPRQAPSPIAIALSPTSPGTTPQKPHHQQHQYQQHHHQQPQQQRRMMISKTTTTAASSPPGTTNLVPKGVSQIVTSREWVLPPRPKPGRKPSVDTPASKRKAQNRAAQRAFRERRATRVQELEQKLMEVEKEKDIKEMGLLNTINKLKVENQFLLKSLEQLRQDVNQMKNSSQSRYQQVQPQQQQQVRSRGSPSGQQQNSKPTFSLGDRSNHASPMNTSSPSSSTYSVQQISPAPSADSPPSSSYNHSVQPKLLPATAATLTPMSKNSSPDKPASSIDTSNFDCGICLKDECLCESVGLKDPVKKTTNNNDIEKNLQAQLDSFQSMPAVSLSSRKRKIVSTDEVQEIDFTKQFSTKTKPMPDLKKLKKSSHSHNHNTSMPPPSSEITSNFDEGSPVENCGFCSDDTPCVCREAAKEAARLNNSLNEPIQESNEEMDHLEMNHSTLPPIQYNNNKSNNFSRAALHVMHPGPSVEIREITNLTPGAVPTVLSSRRNNNDSSTTLMTNDSSSENNECTGNPGTCRQCQLDPMSTLFCTTVASKNEGTNSPAKTSSISRTSSSSVISSGMQPLLAAANAAAAASNSTTAPATPVATSLSNGNSTSMNSTNSGIFIPCADAYKTLSRHKKFNSVDFGTLVGKLTTRGMQVEVQSVANVLRELDRRLYN
ncbi:uncharacterized protein J8A68_004150 [[Candida] subhashii]|uniref:BZIP domain-containing protein n=1 Tax=[Candida] subhashii TaxID=561895 RepID=A0A8J5QHZ6_9ASCO|nr:uncharacterized protein J8A68_004150 [[Candida] subhashii]KAG7662379.1 hypothetical protein J8A68_004150 [[Candida] subhashii]